MFKHVAMRHRSVQQTQLGLIESNVENDGLIIFCGTTRITVSLAAELPFHLAFAAWPCRRSALRFE